MSVAKKVAKPTRKELAGRMRALAAELRALETDDTRLAADLLQAIAFPVAHFEGSEMHNRRLDWTEGYVSALAAMAAPVATGGEMVARCARTSGTRSGGGFEDQPPPRRREGAMTGPHDTTPAPPAMGVDVEYCEALADDLKVVAMTLETAAYSIMGLVVGLRKQAAQARPTK